MSGATIPVVPVADLFVAGQGVTDEEKLSFLSSGR